ncbi:hypothetical protein [uncultured Photobacterium sp.]|uniref:TOTE conflict system archaeo-eukaryotic primase domain-containing protein n=1 Tax=uncultured Photobacterium sp. TaxID=173973 RepID=UPI0026239037|nr:hypothetical protein [uncultured Photobacterium sp.]
MPDITNRDHLTSELEAIDIRLRQLDTEKQKLLARKQELLKQQNLLSGPPSMTPEQKIAIFADLFKGRSDIYATRWENGTGRNGYSLACDNEWKNGVCAKPKVKCGECPN